MLTELQILQFKCTSHFWFFLQKHSTGTKISFATKAKFSQIIFIAIVIITNNLDSHPCQNHTQCIIPGRTTNRQILLFWSHEEPSKLYGVTLVIRATHQWFVLTHLSCPTLSLSLTNWWHSPFCYCFIPAARINLKLTEIKKPHYYGQNKISVIQSNFCCIVMSIRHWEQNDIFLPTSPSMGSISLHMNMYMYFLTLSFT